MIPQEFIENMGAGWNLGNTYECKNVNQVNNKYRYWGAGNWNYTVLNENNTITAKTGINVISYGAAKEFNIQISYPSSVESVTVKFEPPFIKNSIQGVNFEFISATIDSKVYADKSYILQLPKFVDGVAIADIRYDDILTLPISEISGKKITCKFKIIISNLEQYPTTDETVLSQIRTWYCTAPINSWGSRVAKEAHIKAVAAIGFKSIRIPISWTGHYDDVDELGNVKVDVEFLQHLENVIGFCHKYNLLTIINMHHDDQDWLKTGKYNTDPVVSTRYKSIWKQVATYFANYGDWLAFASNNETRNDKGTWEGSDVKDTDIFGLMKMQKDFYDVVRVIHGNENRICLYPTYAAKTWGLNSVYKNPDDVSDTGKWGLPYEDPHGIAEIHPYSNSIADIQKLNKAARTRGLPVIYGEYGVNNNQTTEKQTCINQAYMVAYAKYYGIGTILWDDFGGMKMLERDKCSMTNSEDFSTLWTGTEFGLIQAIVASAELKQVDIVLSNRRKDCYAGDTVQVYLDTNKNVIVSNEGDGSVNLSGNTVTAGVDDISNLLAISYNGEYNTIDIKVYEPSNFITTEYTDGWECYSYSAWDNYRVMPSDNVRSLWIPVHGCDRIQFINTTNTNALAINEYSKNKTLLTWDKARKSIKSGETYVVGPSCAFVGVSFNNVPKNDAVKKGTKVIVTSRDLSIVEDRDRYSEKTANISNYSNYYVSIYRTITALGGVNYTIDMNVSCDIHIMEYHGNELRVDKWYKNGDSFVTNYFTDNMRVEIVILENKISDIVTKFNNKLLIPKLTYEDYVAEKSKYNETCPHIDLGGDSSTIPSIEKKFGSFDNKILTYNGNIITVEDK